MTSFIFHGDIQRYSPPSHHALCGSYQGLLFFGYGADDVTARYYLGQAVISARRIKLLNPGTNITIVTNPGLEHELEDAFDMVRTRDYFDLEARGCLVCRVEGARMVAEFFSLIQVFLFDRTTPPLLLQNLLPGGVLVLPRSVCLAQSLPPALPPS